MYILYPILKIINVSIFSSTILTVREKTQSCQSYIK